MKEDVKIGVYICHCGGNISDTIDVERVKEEVSRLRGVEVAKTYEYMCSEPGQEMIVKDIKERKLNRIVIASCSPRMHLETFRKTLESAGLNPYLLEMANIREQCSWVHDDKEAGTAKAIDLIRAAIKRVYYHEALEPGRMPVNRNVLVIGGGIAGIMASIELADKGFQVYLVERSPSIGGHMAQLSKTFPTLDCSQCILTPKMVYAGKHPNIKIITMAEVKAIEGSPGNYRALIIKHPRFVDESRCTACGECEKHCPVKVPNEFEAGLYVRKAIYIPFAQAIPKSYVIDENKCLHITKGICGICEKICKGKAIDFNQKEEAIELEVGAIIVCTGFDQINPEILEEYNFALSPDIVTNLQLERIIGREMRRPSDGKVARKVAFILCAGSRMLNRDKGVEHCCKIGCMVAIKQAMLIQKIVPNAEPYIFYTDIRADGKGYEEFYARAQEHNVRFIRGRVAEVIPLNGEILVRAEDTLLGTQIETTFDLVVLSLAIIPSQGTPELARKLGLQLGPDGFLLEKHFKLNPVDSQRRGIFIAGCALGPKDIRETTLEAMATASRVATFLGKGEVSISPEVAYIKEEICDGCGVCIEICPASAIEKVGKSVKVNSVSCIGCGICIPECPKGAIDLHNYTENQLLAQIHGLCEKGIKPKIIAFLEKEIAYGSADLAGQVRQSYPPNIEIIKVPSIGRIGLKHVLYAFAVGADGVIFVEAHDGVFSEKRLRDYVTMLKSELKSYGVEPLRILSTTTTLPEYNKILNVFNTLNKRLQRMGPLKEEVRQKLREKIDFK